MLFAVIAQGILLIGSRFVLCHLSDGFMCLQKEMGILSVELRGFGILRQIRRQGQDHDDNQKQV